MSSYNLDWIDDDYIESAAQYLTSRMKIGNPAKENRLEPIISTIQQTLFSTMDYPSIVKWDRLERDMPIFHRIVLSAIPGWESSEAYDLVNVEKNIYVEFKTYFSYKFGTKYIDRLIETSQKNPDKTYLLVFANGSYEHDVIPARKRIDIVEAALENLKVVPLSQLYEIVTETETAYLDVVNALPSVLAKVSPRPIPPVFISYSRKNLSEMQLLKKCLSDYGLNVWTDEALQPGTRDWQIAIEQSLESAVCVLLLLSPDTKLSDWVRNELNYAQECGKSVVPFWIAGESHEVSMLNLISAQRIDARNPDNFDSCVEKAVESIEYYIHQKFVET